MKSTERIIQLIKTSGPMTASQLAIELQMTSMGVRQHLQHLEQNGDLTIEDRKAKRGRPTRYWSLTSVADQHFENRHDELTVQLIDSVKEIFGDEGLSQLISHRESATELSYQALLNPLNSVEEKLAKLVELRSQEGYMAAIETHDCYFLLLENHCPICAAATHCIGFCRSELEIFQRLFDGIASVNREEHIISGARRCAYKVTPCNESQI
ncbi:helix-turn-helix transcriptional regulator [Echinimonas agarilytica]|uniref:Transcriptional regulator n=1 Tax=Echinimonas agarilytica TaxID=1215918 RepID=A0AA41W5X4_9GAMM|nr:transcriptional regulator [Echinimonas agarilytica]